MDFKQDSPTFNESSKLEANLVNPDEALQAGLPLQCASDMVRIVRWPIYYIKCIPYLLFNFFQLAIKCARPQSTFNSTGKS